MILIGSLILGAICASLIVWAVMQPEIKHLPDDAATDTLRANVIIEAWLKPTNRVKAGT